MRDFEKIMIAAEFDETTGKIGGLQLLVAKCGEREKKFAAGATLIAGGKSYTLGSRVEYKDAVGFDMILQNKTKAIKK